jgi:hypothetical protein
MNDRSFIDARNRGWAFNFTVGTIKRLKAAGVSTFTANPAADADAFLKVISEPDQLAAAIGAALEPELKAAGEDPIQFTAGLDAATLAKAEAAFIVAVAQFATDLGRPQFAEVIRACGKLKGEVDALLVAAPAEAK